MIELETIEQIGQDIESQATKVNFEIEQLNAVVGNGNKRLRELQHECDILRARELYHNKLVTEYNKE